MIKLDHPIFKILNHLPPAQQTTFDPINLSIKGICDGHKLQEVAQKLIPWRKGPFQLFDLFIDSEWRGDLKWNRLKDALPSKVDALLDIGCNNGYYLFKASSLCRYALGLEPYPLYLAQYLFINHYAQVDNIEVQATTLERYSNERTPLAKKILLDKALYSSRRRRKKCPQLITQEQYFDLIFYLGVIYHAKNPIEQLSKIYQLLLPQGRVILESMILPGKNSTILFPEKSYAHMTNVYFLPTLHALINMLKRCHFKNIQIVKQGYAGIHEQRHTPFCPAYITTLQNSLSANRRKTIEGYPAPQRVILSAQK